MNALLRHVARQLVAGFVAILPVGGLVLTVVYLETTFAGSWLAKQPFYFPGLGLLVAVAFVYAVGLVVSTFLGRWLWSSVDRALERLPALGALYQTMKQILGYGRGKEAVFQEVVMLRSRDLPVEEMGLVTNRLADGRAVVFVPGAPNPTSGRLLLVEASALRRVDAAVNDAFKALVSVGKTMPS